MQVKEYSTNNWNSRSRSWLHFSQKANT